MDQADRHHIAQALRAAAEVLAARPIKIDKEKVRREAKRLVRELQAPLLRRPGINRPLGKSSKDIPLGNLKLASLRDVRGKKIGKIRVFVAFEVSPSKDYALEAGIGSDPGGHFLLIVLNGRYSAQQLVSSPKVKDELFALLLHEVTHLLDVSPERPEGVPTDLREYYNRPEEVRAYMQEIVEEVLNILPKIAAVIGVKESISLALSGSPTWRSIKRHLATKNQNLIRKAVYTTLQDQGLI